MSSSIEGRYGPGGLSPGREPQSSLERAPQGIPGKGEPMVCICLFGQVCSFLSLWRYMIEHISTIYRKSRLIPTSLILHSNGV